jgi:ABC-type branched-subunit amino acid transport system permease subunit
MARNFDPSNLSAGDVLRAVTPAIVAIAVLILVGRFAPDYLWLVIVFIVVGVYVWVSNLPKKDLAAVAEKERELEDKIRGIPVVGRVAKPAWRLLSWLALVLGAIMVIVFIWRL